MTQHNIAVDDEVYALLKKEAEPLVDTPNTVLRRLLGLDNSVSESPHETSRNSSLSHLVKANLLASGQKLIWRRRNLGETHVAFVTENGKLRLADGSVHASPSGACFAATGQAINGWSAWHTEDGTPLQALRVKI